MTRHYEIILHPAAARCITLDELAAETDLHPDVVLQFVEYGLIEPVLRENHLMWFETTALARTRTIQRLRHDLGVNLPGIAVALQLLEHIEHLNRELTSRKR